MSSKILLWPAFKGFCDSIGDALHIAFTEDDSVIVVWTQYRGVVIESEIAKSSSTYVAEFNTDFRSRGNRSEADRVRITTCRMGRKLSSRYISFTTASPGSIDNTNAQGVDFGDVTYSMRKADGTVTETIAEAEQTWVDFQPSFNFEIAGGIIFMPLALAGGNDDAWEMHVIGAPDIPANLGGSIPFIANNRIKWIKGSRLDLDANLNPAEVSGDVTALARKMRFVFLHPAGAQSEFQINVRIYK